MRVLLKLENIREYITTIRDVPMVRIELMMKTEGLPRQRKASSPNDL